MNEEQVVLSDLDNPYHAGIMKIMSIQPADMDMRCATHWIDWEIKKNPNNDLEELIQKACEKFSLTLIEVGYLFLLYDIAKKPPKRYPWTDFGL